MTCKATGHFLIVIALLGSAAAIGQDPESRVLENPALANARTMLQAGREDIIREDLHLSDEESAVFWPVYEAYRAEVMVVSDRRSKLVADFLRTSREGALTNDYAETLIEEHFDIKGELLAVQMKFVRQFRKVLPALKVARFYQLENKMDAEIDAQLALFVPLVEST